VIARLPRLHDPVAARLQRALGRAAVAIAGVAVVTALDARVDEAFPARGHAARRRAVVRIIGIAIVALLDTLIDVAVPAHVVEAFGGARVGVDRVAVVALLVTIHHGVAANPVTTVAVPRIAIAIAPGGFVALREAQAETLTERALVERFAQAREGRREGNQEGVAVGPTHGAAESHG